MRKFVRRLSSTSIDGSPRKGRNKHKRSLSEVIEKDSSSSLLSDSRSFHVVHYMGYAHVEDPKSVREVQAAVKSVLQSDPTHHLVRLLLQDDSILIFGSDEERLISSALQSVQDVARGPGDSIAITFIAGRYAKQCHVFRGRSSREAADVFQSLQKVFRGVAKSRRTSADALPPPFTSSRSLQGYRNSGGAPRKISMSFLEDEEEIVEVKQISSLSRRESKRAIHRIRSSGDAPASSTTSSPAGSLKLKSLDSPSLTTPPSKPVTMYSPKPKRRHHHHHHNRTKRDKEFTRQDKVIQLVNAVERVVENNAALKQLCSADMMPQTPLQEAFYAIQSDNMELLQHYIITGRVSVDEADVTGNTLLHYAIAMGNIEAVKLLCDCNVSLDSAGWNECRPLHRAVAEGNAQLLQLLLRRGANVNITDFMRTDPLHMNACKLLLNECVIALLEYGAQIMATDVLGLKPFDIFPELKEAQNRLITSACESFASAQLKEYLPPLISSPSVTSISSSAASSISGDHMRSHDPILGPHPQRLIATPTSEYGDPELNDLLSEVNTRARVIALRSHAYVRRNRFKRSMRSQSIGNLTELREADEEELDKAARLEKLRKFPSELHLDSSYYTLEQNAEVILGALSRLIKNGPPNCEEVGGGGGGGGGGGEVRRRRGMVEMPISPDSLRDDEELPDFCNSEPNLILSSEANGDDYSELSLRPLSSQTRDESVGRIKWKVRQSYTSQSSGSTVVKSSVLGEGSEGGGRESTAAARISAAFDALEEDLQLSGGGKDSPEPTRMLDQPVLRLHHSPKPESLSNGKHLSKQETDAIFEELISQITQAGGELGEQEEQLKKRYSTAPPQLRKEEEEEEEEEEDNVVTNIDDFDEDQCNTADATDDVGSQLGSTASSHNNAASTTGTTDRASGGPAHTVLPLDLAVSPHKSKRGSKRSLWGLISPAKPRSPTLPSLSGSSFTPGNSPPAAPSRYKRKMSLPESNLHSVVHGGASPPTFPARSSSSISMSLELLYSSRSRSGTSQSLNSVADSQSEPVFTALRVLTTLSSNKECHATLISYLCLPKCVSRLTSLAQSSHSPLEVLSNTAALMQNLFEVGGAEGKKKALGSGILDLTIKLLSSRDPIPGTCLSLLNSLLVGEDDSDYLRTIMRIPSAPLLGYLEPRELDNDSGYGRRDTSTSGVTYSSLDNQAPPSEGPSSRPSSGLGRHSSGHPDVAMVTGGKRHISSFTSETSEGSSTRGMMSPTLHGHGVTHIEARHIVLKMLAVSSSHFKMQRELSSLLAVQLLADCLTDPSLENVTNAAIALGNVAQNMDSHSILLQVSLPSRLRPLLSLGPRPRYHAARTLVYLNHFDLGEVSLFQPTGYENDTVLMATDSDGHVYARGATIEKCVGFLTGNINQLWGGLTLVVGPSNESFRPKATKDQILNFFLTTYPSFVHPIILMRLLQHRLASSNQLDEEKVNPFDWSLEPLKSTIPLLSPSTTIPPPQLASLNLIAHWMERCPDVFLEHVELTDIVMDIIQRMKLARGPYLPQTHRLRSLLNDLSRPKGGSQVTLNSKDRTPHHEHLYLLCKQMIVGGHLPVTLEQAIFMASLQLHIEEIISASRGRRSFTSRFRAAIPAVHAKARNVNKRVRQQMLDFEKLSERNSKHLYIERCQSMPGYNCTFFSVRVATGGRFRRAGPVAKQQMGISNRHVVFLDEKSKELAACYNQRDVLGIQREAEPCSLALTLHDSSVRFSVESPSVAWEIVSFMEQSKETDGWEPFGDEDLGQWSASIPSLHTLTLTQQDEHPTDSLSSLSSSSSPDRETTPTPDKQAPNDIIKNLRKNSIQNSNWDSLAGPSPSHPHASPLHTTISIAPMSNGHIEDGLPLPQEDKAPFCDCPPDPELPRTIVLQHLTLHSILQCPVEVARQMTLLSHERFCAVTATELLQKVNMLPKPRPSSDTASVHSLSLDQEPTNIEKLAYRFNQVGNWVAHGILQFNELEERVEAMQSFITIAKHCLELNNFSAMMAMMAGLGSAPIRRLHRTWEAVGKTHLEQYKNMDAILDPKGSYKNYRERLSATPTPAVPYIGVFLTDMTFIYNGNPDYLRGGLINIHKRRQVYKNLEEIRHFQQDHYNFHEVPELQGSLLSHRPAAEDELHALSHTMEPRSLQRSHSQASNRSRATTVTTTPNFSFFKAITRSGSTSASNLHRTN